MHLNKKIIVRKQFCLKPRF